MTKTLFVALLASLVAFSGFAASNQLPAEANVIVSNGSRTAFLFPVAGSVEGANGTYFHTELTLVNFKNADQQIIIDFMEEGSSTPITHTMTLEATSFSAWDDFVASVLQRTGRLGALRIRGVVAGSTQTDPTARLNGFARIWTEQPDGPGTSSMALNPVEDNDLASGTNPAYVLGVRQDAQYRANIGIVNLATIDREFRVEIGGALGTNPATFNVTVPAQSIRQVMVPHENYRAMVAKITPLTPGAWTAYGASVDNQSGDGWVAKAQYAQQ